MYGVSAKKGQSCPEEPEEPEDHESRQSTACGRNDELLKPGCAVLIIDGPVQDGQYRRVAFTHALTAVRKALYSMHPLSSYTFLRLSNYLAVRQLALFGHEVANTMNSGPTRSDSSRYEPRAVGSHSFAVVCCESHMDAGPIRRDCG
jgi:hypothetical protein